MSDPTQYTPEQTAEMRLELDKLVEAWVDRGWSMEGAAGTIIGYGMHMMKAGAWQTIDQLVTMIRSAWPFMKVPPKQ